MKILRLCSLICLAVFTIAVFVYLTGQEGAISFFSPYSLECKGQSEYTVLGGLVPIYRSSMEYYDPKIIRYLRESGYVKSVDPKPNRWDMSQWNESSRDGGFNQHYLLGRQNAAVIEWSKADAERARIYWSEGFKCLRSEDEIEISIGREILREGWKTNSIPELLERIATIRQEIEFEHQWKVNEAKALQSPPAENPVGSKKSAGE